MLSREAQKAVFVEHLIYVRTPAGPMGFLPCKQVWRGIWNKQVSYGSSVHILCNQVKGDIPQDIESSYKSVIRCWVGFIFLFYSGNIAKYPKLRTIGTNTLNLKNNSRRRQQLESDFSLPQGLIRGCQTCLTGSSHYMWGGNWAEKKVAGDPFPTGNTVLPSGRGWAVVLSKVRWILVWLVHKGEAGIPFSASDIYLQNRYIDY